MSKSRSRVALGGGAQLPRVGSSGAKGIVSSSSIAAAGTAERARGGMER